MDKEKNNSLNWILKGKTLDGLIFILISLFFNVKFSGDFIPLSITILLVLAVSIISVRRFIFPFFSIHRITLGHISLGIFLLFYIFSITWTNAPNYAIRKIYLFFPILLLALFWGNSWAMNYRRFRYIYSIVYVVILVYFYLSGGISKIQEQLVFGYFRLNLTEDTNAIVIGTFFGFGAINLLSFFSYRHKWNMVSILKKVSYLVLLIIPIIFSIVMLFFTGSKGPMLALVVSFGGYYFIKEIKSKATIIAFLTIIVLFTITQTISNPQKIVEDYVSSVELQQFIINRFFNDEENKSVSSRVELIDFTFNEIAQKNPFYIIFGSGIGDFGYAFNGKDDRNYPHNIFLEVLYEFGLIGLFVFLLQIFYVIHVNYKYRHHEGELKWLLISYYFFLVRAMTTGDFSENIALFLMIVLIIKYENSFFRTKTNVTRSI